jgi:hypothetical protein
MTAAGSLMRAATAQESPGVTTVTGTVTINNPYIVRDTGEPHMLLLDMTAFAKRDREIQAPLRSQVIAPLEGDLAEGADFALHLPITPQGTINDVDHGQGDGTGVQIYSVEFWANSFDDPFVGPLEGGGWGTALTSLVVTPGDSEVIGGAVVVWAPDERQRFSTDFGPDGRFLTEDDPVGPIPAGWTVVDLNQSPFQQIRTPEVEVTIAESLRWSMSWSFVTPTPSRRVWTGRPSAPSTVRASRMRKRPMIFWPSKLPYMTLPTSSTMVMSACLRRLSCWQSILVAGSACDWRRPTPAR